MIGKLPIVTIVILGFAASVAAPRVISVAPFRSIEVRDGAHVTLRYGQLQNVILLKGADCNSSSQIAEFSSSINTRRVVLESMILKLRLRRGTLPKFQ